jgi:Plasmid pRiA4b ORF-3-like protein
MKTIDEFKLTSVHEHCLRDQVITDEQPGTVLRDFQVLLDFLGAGGVEATGKYNLLPIKFIDELDRCLCRPLRLELKRPQLKSHPYLMGLNLLLRASGLSRVDGAGAKSRLVLDPVMLDQWDRLNPTERYFHLLEAWLRLGSPEMVGERGSFFGSLMSSVLHEWQRLPEEGRRFNHDKPRELYFSGVGRDFYLVALMDLFGLLEVEHPRRPIAPWAPAGLKHTSFGDAVFALIFSHFGFFLGLRFQQEQEQDDDQVEETPEGPSFGAWQPYFQPYFPDWRNTLEFPPFEPRDGTFIFRISLGKVWRRIAVPADATLDDLVALVLHSVNFDSDHLYEFTYRDRLGTEASIKHPAMDEGPWTDEILIGKLPLEPGQTMKLTYDFGDNWVFDVKLERIDPPGAKAKPPRIMERHGKSPEQYDVDW